MNRRCTWGGRQVAMRPDLVFREPGGDERYVGDVKYKLTADARGRSGDYYQLLAYTTAMDLPEGVLIYCRRQDDTRPEHRDREERREEARASIRRPEWPLEQESNTRLRSSPTRSRRRRFRSPSRRPCRLGPQGPDLPVH